MHKKLIPELFMAVVMLFFSGSCLWHKWQAAACTAPKPYSYSPYPIKIIRRHRKI